MREGLERLLEPLCDVQPNATRKRMDHMRWNQVEFEPPSDFVQESGGGSGGRKWLKIFGIGCAGLLLIVGIVTALGVYKGVSCCKDIANVGEQTFGAVSYGMEFTSKVQDAQFDAAHAMFTEGLKGQISSEELAGKYDVPWLSEATLLNEGVQGGHQNMQSMEDVKNIKTWDLQMRLYPQTGDRELVSVVGVELVSVGDESDPQKKATFGIYRLDVEERVIDFKKERPAQSVLSLHGRLQSNDFSQAYRYMSPAAEQGGMASFQSFIEDHGELFTKSVMDIEEVRYPGSETAVVHATLTSEGKQIPVTYTLVPGLGNNVWSVEEISPQLQVDAVMGDEAASEHPAQVEPTDGEEEKNPSEGERVKGDDADDSQ